MTMASVPALVPPLVSLARISRNASDRGINNIVPHNDRGRALVDKMIKGGASALVIQRTEALLSALNSNETEVAQARSSIEVKDSNIPDTLCQADVLPLAAEAESAANPARDAALKLLADNIFDAAECTIAYSNKAVTKLTGYEQADVMGKSPELLQGPGTDKNVLAGLKSHCRGGTARLKSHCRGGTGITRAVQSTTRKIEHPASCIGVSCP